MAKTNPALAILKGDKPTTPQPAAAEPNVVPMVTEPTAAKAPSKAAEAGDGQTRVMVYLPPKVARKFKEMAFFENRKANDLYLEAVDQYLTKQGHGGIKGVSGR